MKSKNRKKKKEEKMFTYNKDVDREIFLRINSDKDFINSIKVNKYSSELCDDKFFYNRTKKYYPLSMKYKTEDSWKKHYLTIMRYRHIIQNKFQRSSPKDGDFKKYHDVLTYTSDNRLSIVKTMEEFIKLGTNEYLLSDLEKYVVTETLYVKLAKVAIKYNNFAIIKDKRFSSYIEKDREPDLFLFDAIIGFCNLDRENSEYEEKKKIQYQILEYLEKLLLQAHKNKERLEKDNAKVEFYAAGQTGNGELFVYFTKKYGDSYIYQMLAGCASGGYSEMVQMILEGISGPQMELMISGLLMIAIEGKTQEISSMIPHVRDYYKTIDVLIKKGAQNILQAVTEASSMGEYEVANYLKKFL